MHHTHDAVHQDFHLSGNAEQIEWKTPDDNVCVGELLAHPGNVVVFHKATAVFASPTTEATSAGLDIQTVDEKILGFVVAVLFESFDERFCRDECTAPFVFGAGDHDEYFLLFCHMGKFRKFPRWTIKIFIYSCRMPSGFTGKRGFPHMKRIVLPILSCSVLLILACAYNPKIQNQETFRDKTGVVGVFRQSAFYCSEANPHYMKLGDSTVVVKPTWSNEQDNAFFSVLKPGPATLYSYSYNCGDAENKFVLDTSAEAKGPIGVVIPNEGFCKIVISFVQGDRLFSHNDDLINEEFKRVEAAIDPSKLPYCEVLNADGSKVSFANRDSLLREQYKAAVQSAKEGSCEDLRPLVVIDSNSDKVTWNAGKDKALMIVAHATPALFENGMPVTLESDLRVFSDREFLDWYKMNQKGVRNWPLRLRQLLGLPREEEITHFTMIWVNPQDMIRPAYRTDVTSSDMDCRFEGDDDSQLDSLGMWLRNWFDDTWAKSYKEEGGYPWTRMGYTYDWGSKGDRYGLSEFLVKAESSVTVQTTKDLKAFVRWLGDRK